MSRTKTRTRKKKIVHYYDFSLLAIIIFLMCFGLVMLYSTSSYSAQIEFGDSMFFLKRQAVFSVAGVAIIAFVSRIDYHIYAKWSKKIFFFAMFMMALVQTPLGITRNHARRWIRMPFNQQLQPSEIAKIAVILFIPYLICKMGKRIHTLKGMAEVLAWGGSAAAGVLFLTDNLSTAIIVMGITCIMIFVVHPKTAPFLIAGGGGLLSVIILVSIVAAKLETSTNFRMRRIIVWLHPESHAAEGGFQIMQALYAIGSGGFFGKGLGNSAQKMILPEAQNDMILSIICEELGVFGAIIVLLLFGMMLYRLLFIAQNAPDLYGSLIVTGIFAHIALQVILNVCVVINLIPTTGITLPFVSYGGTSVVFLMAEMGVALGVSRKIKFEE